MAEVLIPHPSTIIQATPPSSFNLAILYIPNHHNYLRKPMNANNPLPQQLEDHEMVMESEVDDKDTKEVTIDATADGEKMEAEEKEPPLRADDRELLE